MPSRDLRSQPRDSEPRLLVPPIRDNHASKPPGGRDRIRRLTHARPDARYATGAIATYSVDSVDELSNMDSDVDGRE
jgi:hypothetical protein